MIERVDLRYIESNKRADEWGNASLVHEFLLRRHKVKGGQAYHVSNFHLVQEWLDQPASRDVRAERDQLVSPTLSKIKNFDLLARCIILLHNSVLLIAVLTVCLHELVVISLRALLVSNNVVVQVLACRAHIVDKVLEDLQRVAVDLI